MRLEAVIRLEALLLGSGSVGLLVTSLMSCPLQRRFLH